MIANDDEREVSEDELTGFAVGCLMFGVYLEDMGVQTSVAHLLSAKVFNHYSLMYKEVPSIREEARIFMEEAKRVEDQHVNIIRDFLRNRSQ